MLRWMRILLATIIFAVGIFLGIQYAKPPPPPDFDAQLAAQPETAQPATASTSETDAADGDATATESVSLDDSLAASEQDASEATQAASGTPEDDATAKEAVGGKPRVAIIIDDLGRSLRDINTLTSLGVPLTYAVLPFESKTPEVTAELRRRGAEMLCHLPMEASGNANPGPGALRLSMNRRELGVATRKALAAVPGAVGVNNHMGSGLTADREAMKTILEVLSEVELYFIDSRTSSKTVGYDLARQLGIPTAQRHIFLDNDRDPAALRKQFEQLLVVARRDGRAIAIGHPYPETLAMLAEQIPLARQAGFDFVEAGSMIR